MRNESSRKLRLALVLASLLAAAGSAHAAGGITGDKKSALDKLEEGDAVRKRVLLRGGRFEAAPAVGFTLGDAFSRNVLLGGQLTYHFTESWALGATVFGGLGVTTGLADDVKSKRPEKVDGDEAFSNVGLLGSLDVYYSPLIGKFALFGRNVLHYDLHLLLGVGGASVSGTKDVEGFSLAPVAGIGMRTFLNDWFSVNLSLRDYIYSSAINAVTETNESGGADTSASDEISNNFAVTIGAAFYFPQAPETSN
jgi:outer membrane beta-barrel protein